MGQSPPSAECNTEGRGLPFFQGNGEFGDLHPTPKQWIATEFKVAESTDVLLSVRAPVGELNIAAGRCVIGRGLAAIRARTADPIFVFYLLHERRSVLAALGQGSTFAAINGTDLRTLPVMLPPLPEQKKIAAILSSVDDAIRASQAVLDQTRRVKEGLLQELLTRGIGPDGKPHTRFKQTEIGEVPEGWEVETLQTLCREKITYGIVQCGPQIDGGVPYIRVTDMEARDLDSRTMLRTSPEIAARFDRSRVEPGDIVYALRGNIGETRIVPSSVAGANLTQGTARISPAGRVLERYMLWALRSPGPLRQAQTEAKGSTFKEITLDRLRQIRLPVPSRTEQAAIVERCEAVAQAERSAEATAATLARSKSSLLSDLLTGRVRVTP